MEKMKSEITSKIQIGKMKSEIGSKSAIEKIKKRKMIKTNK
jgi:hypothetical protein